jgi:hypothetical protein
MRDQVMPTWRGRTSGVLGHYGGPRKVMGEATATPSSQGRSFQIADVPDVVITVARDQAAEAEFACMREVLGEHGQCLRLRRPEQVASGAFRAGASVSEIHAVCGARRVARDPRPQRRVVQCDLARMGRHMCVNTEVLQFGPLAPRAR